MFSRLLKFHGLIFISFVLIFRGLLEISYVEVISRRFVYDGFFYNFNLLNYLFSWFLFLISLSFINKRLIKVSDYFFITALLAVIAPLTVVYGYDYMRSFFPVIVTIIVVIIIKVFVSIRIPLISMKSIRTVKHGLAFSVLVSLCFVIFLLMLFSFKGVNFNLNLLDVYDYRSGNKDLVGGGILSYTNNWTYQIFNVFLFSLTLLYKRYFLAIIFFLIQVLFFAGSAHKTILFLPILILGVWFYFRKYKSLIIVPVMFSIVIMLTLSTYFLFDDLIATSMFSRRVFFTPADLTFKYFEFFSSEPFVFWSNSIFSGFIEYPYDLKLTHVIGSYIGKENVGANNGFISSGYAHAGLFGILFYAIILILVLRFLDDTTYRTMPVWFAVSLVIVPIRSILISSDLLTVMLTHGFIVALMLVYFLRRKVNYD